MAKILIIDDSPTIRKMIIASLRPLQASFSEAGSGLDAIEQLGLETYDAITLDLNMPDMHGLDFLRFAREHQMLKNTPVVVITTRSDDDIENRIRSSGVDFYIRKPFQPNELLQVMKKLVQEQEKNSPHGSH